MRFLSIADCERAATTVLPYHRVYHVSMTYHLVYHIVESSPEQSIGTTQSGTTQPDITPLYIIPYGGHG